jgi:hypothetical protein
VAGLLLCAAPLGAVEAPPPRPPASALGLIRDMRLTVLARRAFQADRELARLNLGVKVRDGVATVWGSVPSTEAARLVVARLESIDGIDQVRSEVVVRVHDRPLVPEVGIPTRVPARIQVAKPVVPAPPSDLAARPGDLPELKSLPLPGPPPKPKRDMVVASRPTQPALRVLVERVRQSDRRFSGIPVEVQGNVVVVTRSGSNEEDAAALAQALRRVRGVAEVVLSGD